jgi:hypothetical protein
VPALVRWMIVLPVKSICEIAKGELPKSKPGGAAADLAHADLPDAGGAQRKRLLDGRHHDDGGGAVGERHGGGREGTKDVDDCDAAGRSLRSFEQAVDADVHDPG